MKMPRIIRLPQIIDPRGNLSFLEEKTHFPFEINRAFWTYNVPGGKRRGGHSFKSQNEIIIALSGSVDIVTIDEADVLVRFKLDRPNYGLLIPPKTWRRMEYFSGNAFCLHLSDKKYDEQDYVRETKRL